MPLHARIAVSSEQWEAAVRPQDPGVGVGVDRSYIQLARAELDSWEYKRDANCQGKGKQSSFRDSTPITDSHA